MRKSNLVTDQDVPRNVETKKAIVLREDKCFTPTAMFDKRAKK
jgi:hypothetical protein